MRPEGFAEHVVIIPGASGGIGAAMARQPMPYPISSKPEGG